MTAEGSVAFYTSLNCLTATPVGQSESFSLWFRVTLGLRKIDGAWLVVHEHESVPFEMDGVSPITQDLVRSGEEFVYEFTTREKALGIYHAHHMGHTQVPNGMLGIIQVGEPDAAPMGH